MRTTPPAWFIYVLCGLILALIICLFLLPATAQPSDTSFTQQVKAFFPSL